MARKMVIKKWKKLSENLTFIILPPHLTIHRVIVRFHDAMGKNVQEEIQIFKLIKVLPPSDFM